MLDSGVYLAKGQTRYEFRTHNGNHIIIKDVWISTDESGRRLSGGSQWYPVNIRTDERYRPVDRLYKATRTSKEMGNSFYRDLRSVGYKRVDSEYKPNVK